MRYLNLTIGAVALLLAGAAAAKPLVGHQYEAQAKITLAEARATAVKTRPGVIADQELEKEGGGAGLRYSFDVRSHGVTYEVGVDAKTGKVLENSNEGPHPD